MNNDYVDFKFGEHWASEFNLLAVSNSDRYSPPVYGSVNPNTATIMGKKGVYKWKTQVNEKVFNINIAFDSVTIAQLNKIKKWLEPHKIEKLIFADEPYKYYWAALQSEIDFSFLPFVEEEKIVGGRKIIQGVYKGEMVISFLCIENNGYSIEGSFENLEDESKTATVKGNNFILTDADNDYIENLKIEGKTEQEVKYNNVMSDTNFDDLKGRSTEKEWQTNNLAQIQAGDNEVIISAPYEYSGIAQEQRESAINHKYYASAEINTNNINTALEIAGKNITNSVLGKDINIDDGLIGNVDDLIVYGNSIQETKYDNAIKDAFFEKDNNWIPINNINIEKEKQGIKFIANNKFEGVGQEFESWGFNEYYISAEVETSSGEAALEIETDSVFKEGKNEINIEDGSDNKLLNFTLHGKSEQITHEEELLGEGENIIFNNDDYEGYIKLDISGNSYQEVRDAIAPTEVEGNDIVLTDVQVEDKDLSIEGNIVQSGEPNLTNPVQFKCANVNNITINNESFNLNLETEMGKINDISDTIEKVNEKYKIIKRTKRIQFTGEEAWKVNMTQNKTIRFSLGINYLSINALGNCNRFFIRTTQAHGEYEYINLTNTTLYINILKTSLGNYSTDEEGFKNLLADWYTQGIPLEIYCVSKTQQTIELTNEQQQVMQEIENAKISIPNTHIYSTDEVPPYFKLLYNSIPPIPNIKLSSPIKNCKDNINIIITNNSTIEKEIIFPLQQGQKLMQGDYLADDGIHHKRKQIKLDGTEDWGMFNSAYSYDIRDFSIEVENLLIPKTGVAQDGLCSHFTNYKDAAIWPSIFFYADNSYKAIKFLVDKTIFSSVSQWKTFLQERKTANDPVIVEYLLNEEEIEEYNEQQQEAYNEIKLLSILKGSNELTISSNEINPQGKWIIPQTPSIEYPMEIKHVGDSGNIKIKNNENIFNFPLYNNQKLADGDRLNNIGVEHRTYTISLTGNESITLYEENDDYVSFYITISTSETPGGTASEINCFCNKLKRASFNELTFLKGEKIASWYDEEKNISRIDISILKSRIGTFNITNIRNFLRKQYEEGDPIIVEYKMNFTYYNSYTTEQQNIYDSLRTYRGKNTNITVINELEPDFSLSYIQAPTHQVKTTKLQSQERLSLICKPAWLYGTNPRILISNLAEEQNIIKFTKPVFVNLTKEFGEGNEPTKEWCDENLIFSNCIEGGAPSLKNEAMIKVVGSNINLFDADNHIEFDGKYRSWNNGDTIIYDSGYFAIKIPVLGNMIYSTNSNADFKSLAFYDENFNFLWGEEYSNGETFTTPNKCRYITLALNKNFNWFKLTYGTIQSQSSEYGLANIDMKITGYNEQYKNFPLKSNQELVGINEVYDTLEKDGIHKKIKKIIFDGTEDWIKDEYHYKILVSNAKTYSNNILCNYFPSSSQAKNNNFYITNLDKITFVCDSIESLEDWKNYLIELKNNNKPLTLYYELETEQIIPYSNEQKEWYDNFSIYRKNTQITTVAEVKPYYSFTYDINDTYMVNSTKINEYEKLGLIFNNLETNPRFIVNSTADVNSIIKMKKPIVIDLTTEFGIGQEPNLEWCQKNINFDNSCEYGTPSPKIASEMISIGTTPITIENRNRNLISEQNLLNWEKTNCLIEKLNEKYNDNSICRINFENHYKGSIAYKLQKKDSDLTFSAYIKIIQADNPSVNRIVAYKINSNSTKTLLGYKQCDNIIGEWQRLYFPITKESLNDGINYSFELEHNDITDDNTIIDFCMPQLEEGFTPHDYVPYSPSIKNILTFTEPLKELPNGVKDEFSKEGIIRRIGKHTLKNTDALYKAFFNSNGDYITITGNLGIYIRGDSETNAVPFYCNRFKNCVALYDISNGNTATSSRETEGIGITDTEFRLCLRADLIGAVAGDTREDIIRKYKVWIAENPIIIYYEKETPDIESISQEQSNILNNLTTRKIYNNWIVEGSGNPEIELTYKISSASKEIHPWVTGSNLLDKNWIYNDNNIFTKPYVEVENGDATESGVSASRPVYLLNSGTTDADLNLRFDYITIVSPLIIRVTKGRFTNSGFKEIEKVSEIIIKPFINYQPFIDLYDNKPANWYIDIDSTLGEVYLRHKTDETKVLNLNRFNANHTFLTLADCNFVDYDKAFPTSISEIEGTAIENTIFNKLSVAVAPEAYRLKNADIDWKHTYL